MLMTMQIGTLGLTSFLGMTLLNITPVAAQAPVPGDTPPVLQATAPDYADDTRGVFVPNHTQLRMKSKHELNQDHRQKQLAQATGIGNDDFEAEMRRLAGEDPNNFHSSGTNRQSGQNGRRQNAQRQSNRQGTRGGFNSGQGQSFAQQRGPSQRSTSQRFPRSNRASGRASGGGEELLRTNPTNNMRVDMNNALVRIRAERITVRRVIQRMMDQIGAGNWTIAWDLSQQNRPLTDMEISIDAHEPFIKVLNALLARLQTRSGEPLRVIKHDNTRRLVITDRRSGHRLSGDNVSSVGVETDGELMVTEQMIKEAKISLHYDEIPLVDALESIVNQAGKGQWRLRVYAGLDQVLKPAHIEEPFSTAMERLLRLFNLQYEIFPGGKLVVITETNRFGFTAGQ